MGRLMGMKRISLKERYDAALMFLTIGILFPDTRTTILWPSGSGRYCIIITPRAITAECMVTGFATPADDR
jgi:hypothetical protein